MKYFFVEAEVIASGFETRAKGVVAKQSKGEAKSYWLSALSDIDVRDLTPTQLKEGYVNDFENTYLVLEPREITEAEYDVLVKFLN